MAEYARRDGARLWDMPVLGWRLGALVLAAAPQIEDEPMPLARSEREGLVWTGVGVQGHGPPRMPGEGRAAEVTGDWIGYLSGSGLLLLALAVAFMLPAVAGRRATFGAVWALLLGAALAAFAVTAGDRDHLLIHCLCYALAAASLVAGGVRAALSRT